MRRIPQRLYVRLVGLVIAVSVVGALVSASITQARISARNQAALQAQALALAQGAATAVVQDVLLKDYASIESRLMPLAELPTVDEVVLVSELGVQRLALRKREGQTSVTLDYAHPKVTVPAQAEPTLEEGEAGLAAWHPLRASSVVGWVKVGMSLTQEKRSGRHVWVSSLLASFGVALALVAILALYMQRALRPLERAAKFAKNLAQSPGATFAAPGASQEIAALCDALNHASLRLKANYDEMSQRDAEQHAVLNTAGDAIIALDHQGHIRLFNAAASSAFGLSATQAQARPISDLLPELTNERLAALTESAAQTGSQSISVARAELVGQRNGGTEFPVEVSLGTVAGSSSLRYALVIRDMTEKRLADDRLRLYVRALENSSSGIVISDARMSGAPMMYANAAFTRITGYSADEAIGRSCAFLQGADREQKEIQEVREAMSQGVATNVILRNYRKDGALFWNQLSLAPVRDEAGALTHFVGAITDITERVQAEQAIARRGAQLDLILQMSPDGFVLFDHSDRLVYASPAFCHMTGLSADELSARMSPDVLEGSLRALADPKVPWQPLWEESAQTHTIALIQPERRILTAQVEKSAVSGDRLLLVRDVTRESEVDRMKSEFLSTAAHELRTPMVSIFGFSELLLNRTFNPERTRTMLQTIHRQSSLIVNLINELLDLARIEARQGKDFHLEVQALQPIASEAIAQLLIPGDTRKVQVQMPQEPLNVCVDADKLRQALNNLLSNAYKYSPQGGQIHLHMWVEAPGTVALSVRDEGIGMSPEQLARAFERFYRADPSGNIPGTGLGLCIVKEIIELHGGRVTLESATGQGTTVTMRLPLRQKEERQLSDVALET